MTWSMLNCSLTDSSVALRTCHKLAAKYFGTCPIVARVGKVAYKLQLPSTSKIHPVLRVSQLKKHVHCACVQGYMPEMNDDGLIRAEPVAVLDRRLGKQGNHAVVYVLIQWSNTPKEEATWELYSYIEKRFLQFDLQAYSKGKGLLQIVVLIPCEYLNSLPAVHLVVVVKGCYNCL